MTSIKIVPSIEKKTARVAGCVAAGEHVDVRIVGGASLLPSTTLRLRVKFGPSTIAVFPRADKDDAWARDGEDLTCHLSLDTVQAKCVCRFGDTPCAIILDQVGDKDHTEEPTLFFETVVPVRAWHQEPGADEPYDLERYPDQIRELERKIEASVETVEAAKTAVLDAKGAANAAKEAAQSALGSAQNANAQAGLASAAAQNAAESAERAEQSLSQINNQVEEARNAALASEGSATTAAVEAGKAAESAEDAKTAATEAVAAAQGAVNAIDAHKKDFGNPHKVTKSQIGLGSVDNTADMNKPVSHQQRAALDLKQDKLSPDQLEKIANALTDASMFDKAGDAAKVKADLLIEIGKLGKVEIISVSVLPETGKSGAIYLVPSAKPGDKNLKDEYLWIDGAWELIGSTAVDLSGYAKSDDVERALSEKQDALNQTQLANIADVQNKRDKTDNTCHKTEYGEWRFYDVDGKAITDHKLSVLEREEPEYWYYALEDDNMIVDEYTSSSRETRIDASMWFGRTAITALHPISAKKDQPFTTADGVEDIVRDIVRDKRDNTDNTCHKDEYGEWVVDDGRTDHVFKFWPEVACWTMDEPGRWDGHEMPPYGCSFAWYSYPGSPGAYDGSETSLTLGGAGPENFYATRKAVAAKDESYVTQTGVRNIVKTDAETRTAITTLAEAAVENKITGEDQNLVALIKKYGGTQIKEDEHGEFYYEVEV